MSDDEQPQADWVSNFGMNSRDPDDPNRTLSGYRTRDAKRQEDRSPGAGNKPRDRGGRSNPAKGRGG